MSYFVSRQRSYPDNLLFVEIAIGGASKAGKDILPLKYPGENKNLVSPKDAFNIAHAILIKWDRDYADEKKKLKITGSAGSIVYDFTPKGIAAAKLWADKILASIEKCGACNKVMGNRAVYEHDGLSNLVFCSEICCAKKYRDTYGVEPPQILSNKSKRVLVKI